MNLESQGQNTAIQHVQLEEQITKTTTKTQSRIQTLLRWHSIAIHVGQQNSQKGQHKPQKIGAIMKTTTKTLSAKTKAQPVGIHGDHQNS